jgi:OHCU decarboxylase
MGPQLIVPYTLDANDMRFATPQGFNSGDQFFAYLRDSFDCLYREGATAPRMMSIGLHCRLVGRPGRAEALARFLDHIRAHDKVWVARRLDIARHWVKRHLPAEARAPSRNHRALFVDRFGDVFEHMPAVAERTHRAGLGPEHDRVEGLHAAMVKHMRAMSHAEHLQLIGNHPDLAGKLAQAKLLTSDSTREQAGAGLDRLTPDELKTFTELNDRYRAQFGFPFIIAVKGLDKERILTAFKARIGNDRTSEIAEALRQIERIALLRLTDRLGA